MRIPVSLQLAVAAGILTIALTPLARALALRIGAVDEPGPRRIHREPVPTLGGLAMVVGTLAVAWLGRLVLEPARLLDVRPLIGLTLATIPVVALGIVDDVRGTSPWVKLVVQACAGMVLVHFGYGVSALTNPFGDPIQSGALNGALTVVWVVVVINAINLIDGLDGLASGTVLIASAALWWTARSHSDFYVMFIAALLIGATAGFLRSNFPPAKIFMGDTGSHFLGLALAAVSLLENRKGTAAVTLLFPLVAMGVPIADSVLAFGRRLARGAPVFRGDTEHIHHRLLRLGLSPKKAVFVLWTMCAWFAGMAVLLSHLPRTTALIVLGALAIGLFFVFELLNTIERRRTQRSSGANDAPRRDA
jgi:UDP-GlcNAc:undecaprenyl-phosphate/decaprenyl-phosphate GlcNAc-1-phosphate transferase